MKLEFLFFFFVVRMPKIRHNTNEAASAARRRRKMFNLCFLWKRVINLLSFTATLNDWLLNVPEKNENTSPRLGWVGEREEKLCQTFVDSMLQLVLLSSLEFSSHSRRRRVTNLNKILLYVFHLRLITWLFPRHRFKTNECHRTVEWKDLFSIY